MRRNTTYEIGEIELIDSSSAYEAAGKIWSMTGQLSFRPESAARAAVFTTEMGWSMRKHGLMGTIRVFVQEDEEGDELVLEFRSERKFRRRLLRDAREMSQHLEIHYGVLDKSTIRAVIKISQECNTMNPTLIWSAQNKVKRQGLIEQLYATLLERYAQAKENLAEIRQREKQLVESRDKLRRMSSKLALTEEREKKRLATALHDSVLQSLSATAIKAKVLSDMIDDDESRELLESIRAELSQELQNLRSLTFELSPPILYELGLSAAIEWLGDQAKKEGIEFVFDQREDPGKSDQTVIIMAFQCIREIFANVRKHSRARTVSVSQRLSNHDLVVEVRDDGCGFDPDMLANVSKDDSRFGLMNIKERIKESGGRLDIESALGRGTVVRFEIPLLQERELVNFEESKRMVAEL